MPHLTGPDRPGPEADGPGLAGPVLILGGTNESRRLAEALAGAPGGGLPVITSLAGRTTRPLLLPGEVRVGGYGGAAGLAAYLRDRRIGALVDATHPFAATMTGHAVAAAAETGVPLLVLRRPGWLEGPGDRWYRVPDLGEAAALLPRLGDRVFLTTGRQNIAAFAEVDECWFLSRSVERPAGPAPKRLEVVLDRGPFTLDGERRLIREHDIKVLVTKDSGGSAPKLAAARDLGLPVVMVDRPPAPDADSAATVEEAVKWLRAALPKVAER
jgi:precorrin-6A/cobalt-precorrin-6A reductase